MTKKKAIAVPSPDGNIVAPFAGTLTNEPVMGELWCRKGGDIYRVSSWDRKEQLVTVSYITGTRSEKITWRMLEDNFERLGRPSKPVTIEEMARLLAEAFQAGKQYGIASHVDFKQIHVDADQFVIKALIKFFRS